MGSAWRSLGPAIDFGVQCVVQVVAQVGIGFGTEAITLGMAEGVKTSPVT